MKKSLSLLIVGTAGALGAAGMSRVPMTVLEWAIASSGFSEILPVLAPPLGDTARLSLCGAAALLAMACVAALLPSPSTSSHEKKTTMASVFSRLAHFARGGNAPVAGTDNPLRLRRADAHPDAPPRAPLSVVRDLGERLESNAPVAVKMPGVAPFEQPAPAAMPVFAPPPSESLVEVEPEAVIAAKPAPVLEPVFAPAPLPVPVSEPLGLVTVEKEGESLASLSISQLIDRLELGLRNLQQEDLDRETNLEPEMHAETEQAAMPLPVARRSFAEPVMVAEPKGREHGVEGTLQAALAALRGMNAKAV